MAKRYFVHISNLIDYLIGTYADVADYYETKKGFTIECDLGDTIQKVHITNKQLEEQLGVTDLKWKYDKKDGSLDGISYTRED